MLHIHMPYEEFCIMSANNFHLPAIILLVIMFTLCIIILIFILQALKATTYTVSVYIAEGIFIAESCDVVYVVWKPVSGAELYRLQFLENNEVFLNATTKEIVFNISVSDSKFKNRIFSVEVSGNQK